MNKNEPPNPSFPATQLGSVPNYVPLLIGLAGGSGSGKTTLLDALEAYASSPITRVAQDRYYHDLSHLPFEQRTAVNFDHPDSLEFDQIALHLVTLKQGYPVQAPLYNFHIHTRWGSETIFPRPWIIVEGTLILAVESIRRLFDWSVFVDTPEAIRLNRRIARDREQRGRTEVEILRQFESTVRPMHEQFVAPCRGIVDWILDGTKPVDVLTREFMDALPAIKTVEV